LRRLDGQAIRTVVPNVVIHAKSQHGLAWRRTFRGWPLALWLAVVPATLSAGSYLTGQVFERRGSGVVPVSGARVEARAGAEAPAVRGVETDSMGRYYLDGLAGGPLAVTATHPRYYAARDSGRGEKTVRCPDSGACAQLDFEMLPAGDLEVSVVDSLGLPVEHVSIEIHRLDGSGQILKPAVRTVGGVYRASGLVPGRYRVEAKPAEEHGAIRYYAISTELTYEYGQEHGSVRLVMPFERVYRVSGRILGLNAVDAPQMLVILESARGDTSEKQPQTRLGAPLEPGGHFAVNGVPRGSYSLRLAWGEDAELDLSSSLSRVLAAIEVVGDLPGLSFPAPPELGGPSSSR
jgi:hypothetical protein